MSYTEKDIAELADMVRGCISFDHPFTSIEDFKPHPLAYGVMTAPLSSMPIFLNHAAPHIRGIAKWRLAHRK